MPSWNRLSLDQGWEWDIVNDLNSSHTPLGGIRGAHDLVVNMFKDEKFTLDKVLLKQPSIKQGI